MMSKWNHSVCDGCYNEMYPDREPIRFRVPDEETCCRCGEKTYSGIYVREDMAKMKFCNHRKD